MTLRAHRVLVALSLASLTGLCRCQPAAPLPPAPPEVLALEDNGDRPPPSPIASRPAKNPRPRVLRVASPPPPENAPSWTRVALEVILRGDRFFLVATGHARGIRNPQLLRQSAENRARATLARHLKKNLLSGVQITATWRAPHRPLLYAQLEIPLSRFPPQSDTPSPKMKGP